MPQPSPAGNPPLQHEGIGQEKPAVRKGIDTMQHHRQQAGHRHQEGVGGEAERLLADPLLDDVLASGVGGLQGFQRECGMELEWIRNLCTRSGDPLLIFGAMSVTETLPHGTPEQVREDVKRNLAALAPGGGYVFNTVHNIQADVPPENIVAMWDALQEAGAY